MLRPIYHWIVFHELFNPLLYISVALIPAILTFSTLEYGTVYVYSILPSIIIAISYILLSISIHITSVSIEEESTKQIIKSIAPLCRLLTYSFLILSIHYSIRNLCLITKNTILSLAIFAILLTPLAMLLYPFVKLAITKEILYKISIEVTPINKHVYTSLILICTGAFFITMNFLLNYKVIILDLPLLLTSFYIVRVMAKTYWINNIDSGILFDYKNLWRGKIIEVPGLSINAKTPKLIHVRTQYLNTNNIAENIVRQYTTMGFIPIHFLNEKEKISEELKAYFRKNKGFLIAFSEKAYSPSTLVLDDLKIIVINKALNHIDYIMSIINKNTRGRYSKIFILRDHLLVSIFKESKDIYFWLRYLLSKLAPQDLVFVISKKENKIIENIADQLASLKMDVE